MEMLSLQPLAALLLPEAPRCATIARGPTLRYYCQGPHAWMVIATKTQRISLHLFGLHFFRRNNAAKIWYKTFSLQRCIFILLLSHCFRRLLLDDPHTFLCNDYFALGRIRTCLGVIQRSSGFL